MKVHKPSFHTLFMHLHMILLFAITLLCLQPTTSVPPTNLTDHLALLKFKESIDDDPFGLLSSWNDSIQFCSWHGITCGCRHQRVTILKLEALNLRGTISPYIVIDVAIDVASALCYLHNHCEQNNIHCDLKPSNILLNNEMIAHEIGFTP